MISRKFAVVGSIAALSLAAAPIAAASPDLHRSPDRSRDRTFEVHKKFERKSRDAKHHETRSRR